MGRIDGILFGYRTFSVEKNNARILVNALLSLGITSKLKNGSCCDVRLADTAKLRTYLNGLVDFSESEILGLPGFLYKNRRRYLSFVGFLVATFTFFYASGAVWDVRVVGTDRDTEKIKSDLSLLGVDEGARWNKLKLDDIETEFLAYSDDVGWINVNRRGTVAYVTVKPKDIFYEEEKVLFSNIVADRDGIIEEITVKKGYATVKPGDVVKKGDILISGVIPGELGGGFLRAEGSVVARSFETYRGDAVKKQTVKVYIDEKKSELTYKILGFSINLLKNSGNLQSSCDIIENENVCELFGRYKLPVRKKTVTAVLYELQAVELSCDEMVFLASQRLRDNIALSLSDAELLSIRTVGAYTEDGYTMTASVTVLRDIGKESKFEKDF